MSKTLDVENCPGIPNDHAGTQLTMRMEEQAKPFEAEVRRETVESVDLRSNPRRIKTDQGEYQVASIIITTGASPRKLSAPGEEEFASRGISYCAACDGAFYEGADVFVIGGGDAAVEETHFLARFVNKAYLVYHRDQLRAAKLLQEKILDNEEVKILWDSVLKEIKGEGTAQEVLIGNVKTKEVKSFRSSADYRGARILIYVGYTPLTDFLKGQLDLVDDYIPTDEKMQTEIPGAYTAGGTRYEDFKQVVTVVGEGIAAVMVAEKYLDDLEP